ncbi:MAG TPA: hypothetical protein VN655_15705 [Pseudolabrys sp.]|nr:hypothetical protein [Pseudolabrys sp.]
MSGVDDHALRLRAYLLRLAPQARRRLRGALERGIAQPGFDPAAALVELRRLSDDAEGAAARLFFAPLEPFLVEDEPARRHPGRIARASLAALWAWIGDDLLPHAVAAFTQAANEALEVGAAAHAQRLAREFQDSVAAALRDVFADEVPARRALLARIGTPRAEEEAATLRWALRGRDTLAAFGERLPARIDHLPQSHIPACIALIEGAARPRDVFACALVVFMARLAAPWQVVRLAAHAAGSNGAARVAATPYGMAVDILIAEIERQIDALAAAVTAGEGAIAVGLIRAVDAAIAGVRTEIAIPVGSTLGRRLSALAAEATAVARTALAA